jgi:hypothetical protein
VFTFGFVEPEDQQHIRKQWRSININEKKREHNLKKLKRGEKKDHKLLPESSESYP